MRVKVLTTTSDKSKCSMLEKSLLKFGYDYSIIEHHWEPIGFLNKLIETYRYLKTIRTEYTHFLYTDAWDTVALGPLENVTPYLTDGILLSAEMACYPHPNLEKEYPVNPSPWHFVNGGGWLCNIERFIWLYENNKPTNELNDQVWLTKVFLKYKEEEWMKLDYKCSVFQTIGFTNDTHFTYTDVLMYNNVTDSYPVFIHGNGHTPLDKIYSLV